MYTESKYLVLFKDIVWNYIYFSLRVVFLFFWAFYKAYLDFPRFSKIFMK